MNQLPRLIELGSIGEPERGFLSFVQQGDQIPFVPKRVYWVYGVPVNGYRGGHAHIEEEQVMMAVNGQVTISLESKSGERFDFFLTSPHKALYVPKMFWRTITFSDQAVLVCISSKEYDTADYIRDYATFKA